MEHDPEALCIRCEHQFWQHQQIEDEQGFYVTQCRCCDCMKFEPVTAEDERLSAGESRWESKTGR